ncbi:MAG TPA: biotin carboxylase N-terminal domain-containing protein [Candidatus Binatia bacterium]|jgi:acetyl/propionyl-CoA carboxylase alpha subunit/acetyl-CoA carboxylase carboxyltransferase component
MTAIRRIGIVNRGEAALRCVRAVKALRASEGPGLQAIALYTDVDRDAPFVRHADAAVRLAAVAGAEARAYLDHDLVLAALRLAGADAVWPGWGFVAEDPVFVERLEHAGLVFLGPPAAAMYALGDKIASKQLAERIGVAVTPWSGDVVPDEAAALGAAQRIGFPLVVKASAGGGGRGIRLVEDAAALPAAFRAAQSEARAAFGDGRLFLELHVGGARHVEVQIAADLHGHVRALGARDCSVQRRHQKLIEEAPPPGLTPEAVAALGDAAVRLASAVGYAGLGTVEFLVRDGDAWFLEMNPRLQVEHGITEAITGLDLVQLQIRIARGERIDGLVVREQGAAVEARVCAEDPDAGFLPAPGRIARFDPALGPGIRIDTGVVAGSVVPAAFDSLIAKVIATGATRAEAHSRLAAALADLDLVIEGGATNAAYLAALLQSDELRAGAVDTGWIERRRRAELRADDASDALVGAAILAYQRRRRDARANFLADPTSVSAARVPPSLGQEIDLAFGGEAYRLHVFALGSWRYRVHLDGRAATVTLREGEAHLARLEFADRTRRIAYDATAAGLRLELDGQPYRFGWETTGHVRAAMPAVVVGVQVAPGDQVAAGQVLGFLEAMKVEIGFATPVAGAVREIRVATGQLVAAGDVLIVVEPAGGHDAPDPHARLELDREGDALAALLLPDGATRDLSVLNAWPAARQQATIGALRDEIRSVIVGYDADPERAARLAVLLESSDEAEQLSTAVRDQLAALVHEIVVFADLEQLFLTAPRAARGRIDPSNAARLRFYVRRMRADGAGIAEDFLRLLRTALAHYGVSSLAHGDALERALLRLFATQNAPDVRRRLVQAVLRCLIGLARTGAPLADGELGSALTRIAGMRALVSDALSDTAIEAHAVVFESPALARRAARAAERVALDETEWSPPHDVLLDLAATPRPVFGRVASWMFEADARRAGIALSAYLLRMLAPAEPFELAAGPPGAPPLRIVTLADGRTIVGVVCAAAEAPATAVTRARAAVDEHSNPVHAIEVILPLDGPIEPDAAVAQVEALFEAALFDAASLPAAHCTLSFVRPSGDDVHRTVRPDGAAVCEDTSLLGLHPETAARIGFARLASFALERLPGDDDLHCFSGRSRAVPDDARLLVLAEVRGRTGGDPAETALDVAAFERVFRRTTSAVRALRGAHDPRRRLHWNRIVITVGPALALDRRAIEVIARRLAPATRHLGLEKVLVRLRLHDPASGTTSPPVELVVSDPTGTHLDVAMRAPSTAALAPASDYERKVVEARRRRLVYPYEIVRMLTGGNGSGAHGTFEEYDLDPVAREPQALRVAGRPYGRNEAGIVFGVMTTPAAKVPEGLSRVLLLSDPTRDIGALGAPECDRVVAAIDLAVRLRLPVEWIPISAGARIALDSGTENLDATARVVRRIIGFTAAGGTIHVVVYGVNVGAQSYWNALATMLGHTHGVLVMTPDASMVLTGRAALEASGSVSAEDEVALGGFERTMGINGEAQYYADDLPAALAVLAEHQRYAYVVPGESGPRWLRTADPFGRDVRAFPYPPEHAHGFATLGEVFDDATNPGRKRPFAMRAVMQALIDQDGGHLERWHAWVGAETAIVWDAHLGGVPISLIGIESEAIARDGYRPLDGPAAWTGGTLFPLSSKKVARALNAASGNRPVVILANLAGFDGSPESLRKLQLEYGAEIARAVVGFEGPLLFLVVSRYHGGAYVVFSQSLNPRLHALALTGSYASVIGGSAAAAVVFTREVRARAAEEPAVREALAAWRARPSPATHDAYERALAAASANARAAIAGEFDAVHTVERARRVGSLADIIEPRDMRPALIRILHVEARDPAAAAWTDPAIDVTHDPGEHR